MIALDLFASTIGRTISCTPADETSTQRRVRALEDTLKRCQLFDAAGLRIQTSDGRETAQEHLQPWLESELTEARRVERFERGRF
jgi:hypothetical protein